MMAVGALMIGVREGDVVAGKYRVERLLGVGGMGVVVAAHHVQLDEKVALKFLLPEALGNAEAVARFAREAQAAVKIKSEHVARVSDVGALPNGAPFMVMEYLEGADLGAWVELRGVLPVELAVEFVLQACVAIAEAHALGIFHRDLKPANLFCVRGSDGQLSIKVLDFGISKISDAKSRTSGSFTKTRASMGSPTYMSPEQMRSAKDVDARADIWALGMILFELLSGRPAFEADTEMALAIKVTGEPAPPIRAFRPDAPTELEAVISRCLEKDRESRYPNVAELALALAPFAPERSTALIERISGIIRAAGLSRSAHALAPPSLDAEWPLPAPTRRAAGRATRGTSTRLLALTGAGVGTLVALVAVAGALVFGRPRAHRDDDPQTTAQEVPQPVHPQAPVASSPKPAGTAAADTTAADAGPVVTPPAAPAAQTTPAPTQTSTPPARGTSRAAPAPTPKAASIAPCKLVTTVDKNGEPHFSCPCATCR